MAVANCRFSMRQEIANHFRRRRSFAFETILAGRTYDRLIPEWRRGGYHVKLIFLQLPGVELAVVRVAARVAQGGHDVLESVVRRRFLAGLSNFHGLYKPLVDAWVLYDHSGSAPRILDVGGSP